MQLKPGAHIHFMGICGTAMASLAGLLKQKGFQISGSDQNVYPPMSTQLAELGIQIQNGYRPENLNPRPDLVIVGNVIAKVNSEAQALLTSDIPYTSLPKALGEFVIAQSQSIVVAGTHGKTTTTSMMAWVCHQLGMQPGFLIGGIPNNFKNSFSLPIGPWFVIEGDEYDTAFFDKVPKFVHYRPKYVLLTSIEFDHADIYRDLDHVKSAFRTLIELIPEDGLLIANAEDTNIQGLLKYCRAQVVTYGEKAGDYQIQNRHWLHGRSQFSITCQGKGIADIAIRLYGPHNAMNATAVFALSQELKWTKSQTLQALADFAGVKRRQEVIGTPRNITVIEDFAHHPSAVAVTLRGVKESFPRSSVYAVFEPRSATSRRRVFQQEYVAAFSEASDVCIAPAFDQSKLQEEDRFSVEELVEDLLSKNIPSLAAKNNTEIIDHLVARAKPGDVILLMSNGGFGGIYPNLLAALETGLTK